MLNVSESELSTLFDDATFRRGRSYSREGAVADLREDGDRVRARIQGSRPRPYEVWVRRDGSLIVSQCSCPGWAGARRHCKHVAALLYTLHEQNPSAAGPAVSAAQRLPSPTAWLPTEAPKLAVPLFYSFTLEGDAAIVRQLRADNGIPPEPALLEALPTDDRRIGELLSLFPEARVGRRVELTRAGDVLAALRGKALYADDRKEIPLAFSPDPLGLRIAISKPSQPDEPFRFRATLSPKGSDRAFGLGSVKSLGGVSRFALANDVIYPLDPRLTDAALSRLRAAPDVECRAPELARAFGEWLPRLVETAGAQVPAASELLPTAGGVPSFELVCDGDLGHAAVKVEATYGDGRASVTLDPLVPAPASEVRLGADGEPYVLQRDVEAEREALGLLEAAGLAWLEDAFRAEGEVALRFWSEGIGRLPIGWRRRLPPGLTGLRVRKEPVRATLNVGFGARGWFEVDLRLGHPEVEVDPAELRNALAAGLSHVTLKDGSVAPIDRAQVEPVLAALDDSEGLISPGHTELPPWLAGLLSALVAAAGGSAQVAPEAAALLKVLEGQAAPKVEVPKGLVGQLRPYQAAGYAWLCFLQERGLGALL
ncbi:MAG: SWIM zinc finger family protein, partial [Deltaproteobacteria bacterium]